MQQIFEEAICYMIACKDRFFSPTI